MNKTEYTLSALRSIANLGPIAGNPGASAQNHALAVTVAAVTLQHLAEGRLDPDPAEEASRAAVAALKALLWQHDNHGALCGMALQDARAALAEAEKETCEFCHGAGEVEIHNTVYGDAPAVCGNCDGTGRA